MNNQNKIKLSILVLVSIVFVVSFSSISASVSLNNPVNASDSAGVASQQQQLAISGSDVDVVYQDGSDVYYDNNSAGFVGTRVKQSTASASFPEIAVSGINKHLVWLQSGSLLYNNDVGNPSSAQTLLTGVSSSATTNMLAASGSDAHIVYRQSGVLKYIRSTDNFASSVTINAGTSNNNQQLAVSISDLHVVWQDSTGVYYKNNLNNFADPALLLGSGTIPQLAVTGSDVHFVWKDSGLIPSIQYANLISNILSSPITISDGANAANNPKIMTDGGNVYVVWQETIGTNSDVFFASSANGFTPINLSDDLGSSTDPQIASSGNDVTVTWKDTSFNSAIYMRSSSNGGNTFGSFVVLSDAANTATNPKLKMSGSDMVSSWLESISGSNDVFVRTATTNANLVEFNQSEYILSDIPVVSYAIVDMAGDTISNDTITVNVTSTSDDAGILVDLTESGDTGIFTGTFLLTFGSSDDASDTIKVESGGLLSVSHLTGSASSHIAPITVILDEGGISTTNFDFGAIAGITVYDSSANLDDMLAETVNVHVTTTQDPIGLDLTLTETDVNTGIFDNAKLAFMIGNDIYSIDSKVTVSLENSIYDMTGASDTITVPVTSTTTPGGIDLLLEESGSATGIFSGTLTLSSSATDAQTGKIKVSAGDFVAVIDPSNSWGSTGMISPNPNTSNGIIEVVSTGDPLLTVTYGSVSDTAQVLDLGAGGGGAGGVSRGGFVQALGALAVFGGASVGSSGPPSFDSSFTVLQDDEVLSHGTNPKSTESAKFEIGTDSSVAIGFSLPGGLGELDHVGLYANIGPGQTKYDSDTYIYFDKFKTPQVTIHDPNGIFKSADASVIEKDGRNLEMIFDLNFAKVITNNNVIVETWNLSRQSAQVEIPNLITVIGPKETTPNIETQTETLQEQTPPVVPVWIKKNAGWWGQGQINDETFTNGIGFLIQNRIIDVPDLMQANISPEISNDESQTEPIIEEFSPVVPVWVKNTASWWSQDMLSDDEFLQGVKYLLENGIIKVRV
jgi:hypothetical protein